MLVPSILTGLLAIASAELTLNASEPAAIDSGIPHHQPRLIPVKEVGCWSQPLLLEEAETAKIRFEEWGSRHHIPAASYRGQVSGHMAVWICNCKRFQHDHVVRAELDEAQQLIAMKCGTNTTGWVWSSKWLKSINFGPRTIFTHRKHDRIGGRPGKVPVKCPKFCVAHSDRAGDDDDPHDDLYDDDLDDGNDDNLDDSNGDNAGDGNDDSSDDGQGDDDQDGEQTG
ncbi:hypothetical protein F4782DRAFT_550015 [Xylaria castorea]|nr:hypothetical protein F4782DRAFT_550015 [Xylaria castorea]